jgi:hypothetical protein
MEKTKRGFLQSMMDAAIREDIKYGEKGKPRKKMGDGEARKKSENEAWAELAEGEE